MPPALNHTIVNQEKLAQLLSVNLKTTLANSFLAIMLAYIQSEAVPLIIELSWLFAVLALNTIRFFIAYYFIKHPNYHPQVIIKRLNIFRIGLILCAFLWGISSFLVYSPDMYEQQVFVSYMLAGLAAGSAVVYSVDLICAFSFAIVSVTPMVILFMLSSHQMLGAMVFAAAIFVLFIVVNIKAFHRSLVEGILLRVEALESAKEIKQLAFYDPLTSLPNRRLLLEELDHVLQQTQTGNTSAALVFLDLDNFKTLNDTYGHEMGDALLIQVAKRLKQSLRPHDIISRFGGDEFVILLSKLPSDHDSAVDEVKQIGTELLAKLNQPYPLADLDYKTTPSLGIAIFKQHGNTKQALLKHADNAMYHSKRNGRNQFTIYDESMNDMSDNS